jgi:viroplasmin and RNaseH domain-containing protein
MRLSNLLRSFPVGKTLNESKDRIVSGRLKQIMNEELKPYGEILELRVNTLEQCAACSIRLNGETEVLDLVLSNFKLSKTGNLRSIEFDGRDIQTSRQWLTALLHDKLGRKTVPLPEQLGWLIEFLS